MYRNYIKTSFRILQKDKAFSLINIAGLAIGMVASLLIFQYVSFELSYDKFHEHAESIYRVQHDRYIDGELQYQKAQSFIPLGETMTLEYPEVIDYTTLFNISDQADIIITHLPEEAQEIKFVETDVYHVKGNFFNIFTLPLIEGDANLKTPDKGEVLISQTIARKYFGDQSALNKSINHLYFGDYKVVGVFEDSPENSHIKFSFLFAWESLTEESQGGDTYNWHWDDFYNYILLNKESDVKFLESKFPDLVSKYMADRRMSHLSPVFSLQPLTSIHLHSHLQGEAEENASVQSVQILFALGLLIMVIAWANYINLSTAKALGRAKEVGIRKSIGSTKRDLVKQFLIESFMVNAFALLLAVTIIQLGTIIYFELRGQEFPINQSITLMIYMGYFILVVIGAFLSGIYPALILSSFQPSIVLKSAGHTSSTQSVSYLRKVMVVLQFTISMALVIGSVSIFKQLNFMQEKELGINMEQTIVLRTMTSIGPPGSDSLFIKRLGVLKNKLSYHPAIKGSTASYDIPGKKYLSQNPYFKNVNNKEESISLYYTRIDADFIEMFEVKLVAGTNFSYQSSSNRGKIIINIEALETFGFSSPDEAIGAKVVYGNNNNEREIEIIGVVNFRATSFKEYNYPIVFQTFWGSMKYFSVKIDYTDLDHLNENIQLIQENWVAVFPDKPFDYFFLDDFFNQQYKSELLFSNVLNIFTGFAIFVSCLGLYGLSIFIVGQKSNEIGIRKVLGASIQSLVKLLSKDIILLVLISGVIALPIIWTLINSWLENYPYRTEIQWWVILSPIIGIIAIALFTISGKVLKAALTNPVDIIRND